MCGLSESVTPSVMAGSLGCALYCIYLAYETGHSELLNITLLSPFCHCSPNVGRETITGFYIAEPCFYGWVRCAKDIKISMDVYISTPSQLNPPTTRFQVRLYFCPSICLLWIFTGCSQMWAPLLSPYQAIPFSCSTPPMSECNGNLQSYIFIRA